MLYTSHGKVGPYLGNINIVELILTKMFLN